jgi:uncharacterized protein YqeY
MTDLKTRVAEDVKAAMRARDSERLSVLRMLSAELKQREVVESQQLTDTVVMGAVEKLIKQRREAESQYRSGNRPELAAKEAAEIAVLARYLPEPLASTELESLIATALAETGATAVKDMGKVMAWVKPRVQGRADMSQVSALIKARLG